MKIYLCYRKNDESEGEDFRGLPEVYLAPFAARAYFALKGVCGERETAEDGFYCMCFERNEFVRLVRERAGLYWPELALIGLSKTGLLTLVLNHNGDGVSEVRADADEVHLFRAELGMKLAIVDVVELDIVEKSDMYDYFSGRWDDDKIFRWLISMIVALNTKMPVKEDGRWFNNQGKFRTWVKKNTEAVDDFILLGIDLLANSGVIEESGTMNKTRRVRQAVDFEARFDLVAWRISGHLTICLCERL